MTRITAENIRARMEELQEQMLLLEKFNVSGYYVTLCDDDSHTWELTSISHDADRDSDVGHPTELLWLAHFRCSACGVETTRTYVAQKHDGSVEDPWAALRPEQEEE